MEYYLRQIEPGASSPFLLDLTLISYVLGRDRECTGYLKLKKYPQVTDHHACFVRKEDDWYVADMGSPDGTYLNYHRLESFSLIKLEVGDHIGFGTKEVTEGFVCALCVKCPPKIEIKMEIKEELSCTDSESCYVSENQKTDSYSKDVIEHEPISKKIKAELLELEYGHVESTYKIPSDQDIAKSKSVAKRIQKDSDSFEQILRSIPYDKPIITRSSQKQVDDWTKKTIELSAMCFGVPSKTEKDARSSETQEVLDRIQTIRKSLQSKGRIQFGSNSSF